MTEMYYHMLLGHIGLYDEGKKLHSMKEVADFIHTHDCGYIAEADGTLGYPKPASSTGLTVSECWITNLTQITIR